MGAWGAGLYSSDYAMDLRSTIRAVARLPYEGERLLEILRGQEAPADDPVDEDHTNFWLVVADQFTKRGITCPLAIDRALQIIADGSDLKLMRSLGLAPAGLRAREKKLCELADLLRDPPTVRARTTLKKPQPLLLEAGSVWAYPTMGSTARNPYFGDPSEDGFVADGWGALLVVGRGRALDWLAWYAVAVLEMVTTTPATLDEVRRAFFRADATRAHQSGATTQILGGTGTLSPVRKKRLDMRHVGDVALASESVPGYLLASGEYKAIADICLSNVLSIKMWEAAGSKTPAGPTPRLADWLQCS